MLDTKRKMDTHHGAYDQPFLRMLSTVNWITFCVAMPAEVHGIGVLATHKARVPLGPPWPSRTMLPT